MKGKNIFLYYSISYLIAGIFFFGSCDKEEAALQFNPEIIYGTVTDMEGNVYKTVTIGDQTWMAENLKSTKYNDGTDITLVTVDTTWGSLTTEGYCWYNNDEANKNLFGALYNWEAVNSGKLAPEGYHVPTDAEWTALATFLGGNEVAGGKLKAIDGWSDPNISADNSTGFTAMPGGYRDNKSGKFFNNTRYGFWWTATQSTTTNGWYRGLGFDYTYLNKFGYDKGDGMSVRCIKNL